jgi:hypothetical protein
VIDLHLCSLRRYDYVWKVASKRGRLTPIVIAIMARRGYVQKTGRIPLVLFVRKLALRTVGLLVAVRV